MNAESVTDSAATPINIVTVKPPLTAREGLHQLVLFCVENRHCSTAETLRELLLSLYNGGNRCDLSAVQNLDTRQRRALAALLTGLGTSAANLWDYEIRDTFAQADGEAGLRWFLARTPGKLTRAQVASMLAGAQRNPAFAGPGRKEVEA